MTNRDIMSIFKGRYSELKVDDYRPLCNEFVKGKEGITIWLENGDILMYFPNTESEEVNNVLQ